MRDGNHWRERGRGVPPAFQWSERFMPAYRFDFIGATGHIERVRRQQLRGDQQAEVYAEGLLQAAEPFITVVEAWEHTRLVCRVRRDRNSD